MSATSAQTGAAQTSAQIALLKLRDDLKIQFEGTSHVVLEDPAAGQFYRLGLAEYALARHLNGELTIQQAWEQCGGLSSNPGLSQRQALALGQWLLANRLATPAGGASTMPIAPASRRASPFNLLYCRVPLLHPDRTLSRLVSWLDPLFSWPATIAAALACITATVLVWQNWREFTGSFENIFSPERELALLVSWLVLKLLHECGHGLVCRRYGGFVREAGIVFIVFAPVPYVDVTSCWRFPSRWQRLHTAAAGMYVELFLAALCVFLWRAADSPWLRQAAADAALLASAGTLLFNLNPLMKFDGYYMLTDFLGLENLYDHGRRAAGSLAKRVLLGVPAAAPAVPPRWQGFVLIYGVASALWRVVVVVGIVVAVAHLLYGAGVLLAIAGITLASWKTARRAVRYLRGTNAIVRPRPARATFGLLTAGGIACIALFAIPFPLFRSAPAIVEYSPPTVVRMPVAAFVDVVHVHAGQRVHQGELLFQLRSDTLALQLARKETELSKAQLNARVQYLHEDPTAHQLAKSDVRALEEQLAELRQQLKGLEVRAPVDGQIVGRRLDALLGTYLEQGAELVTIGVEDRKRLKLSLDAADAGIAALEARRVSEATLAESSSSLTRRATIFNREFTAFFPGCGAWPCRISHLNPRATSEVPHVSLAAPHGGPLTVIRDEHGDHKLAEPRFVAYVELDADQSRNLRVGQRGSVSLGPGEQNLWNRILRAITQFEAGVQERHRGVNRSIR